MIVVTGASGQLGRLVIEELHRRATGEKVVAAVRTPEKAQSLSSLGAEVRWADYEKPESLEAAFKGADKVLLISSSEIGKRAAQHQAAIDAAKKAGVKHLVYTSAPRADTSGLKLAGEHKATEAAIVASGIPYTLLRNGWYIENYTGQLAGTVAQGTMFGCAGDGLISGASRADLAAAAVAVLTTPGHEGKIYELGGASFTMTQLAAKFSAWAGKTINYVNLPQGQYVEALVKIGLPAPFADILADSDANIAKGALELSAEPLTKLLGRAPETVEQVLARLPKP